jgi:FtsP/CotA-like multicopper oxidase with cupredoxin domain
VPPGGTFDYDFRVPDAGLFWYHPHVDTITEVAGGLYGALVVEDPTEPQGLGDEVVFVLSDIDIQDDGGLAAIPADPIFREFGTEGNVVLVNGRAKPELLARAGARQRWRFVNAARSRYFELALPGHVFTQIGTDGGFLTAPRDVDTIVLAPGERVDLSVAPQGAPGSDLAVQNIPFDRGFGTTYGRSTEDLFSIHLDASSPTSPNPLPSSLRSIDPIDMSAAHQQNVIISYLTDGDGGYQINDGGDDAMLHARVGDVDVWTIENQTDFAHPFHLHGFFFQPLDDHGQPTLQWKDTWNVPAHSRGKFVVHYDARPGNWMYHCHILEHAEIGLMGMLMLAP